MNRHPAAHRLCLVLCAAALAAGAAPAQAQVVPAPSVAPAVAAPVAASASGSASASAPQTVTLAELYRQALPNEARLKLAEAGLRASSEQLPQARSQLRPQVSGTVSRFSNRLDSSVPGVAGPVGSVDSYISANQTLQLRQPLYRPVQWAAVKSAGHVVASAQAQRDQEFANAATRIATAYFDAVLSTGQVHYTRELVESLRLQLLAAQKTFAAGTGLRTDVDEMQAQLDAALADQIDAQQYQAFSAQQLAVLLGGRAASVPGLRLDRLEPLLPDAERDIPAWQDRARSRNAEIRQLQEQVAASKEDIARAEAGHKPTLDAIVQRSRSSNENVTRLRSSFDNTSVGLQLNIPIYAGGSVSSQARQAVADFDKAGFALEAAQVDLDNRVRREHRSVVESVSRHRALQQAVASARTAQRSAEKSFEAGVRTRVDIARAAQRVSVQQRDLLQAACTALLARLRLELLAAGNQDEVGAAVQWLDGVLR